MKLPATRFIPVEMEVGRKPASEAAQALEQGLPVGCARDHERARTGGVDLDVVALLQLERLDDGGGQTHGQAVAPFGNLHTRYTLSWMYIRRQPRPVACRRAGVEALQQLAPHRGSLSPGRGVISLQSTMSSCC